jgi:hypothetical protein
MLFSVKLAVHLFECIYSDKRNFFFRKRHLISHTSNINKGDDMKQGQQRSMIRISRTVRHSKKKGKTSSAREGMRT